MNDIATDPVDPELVAQLRADFEPAQAIAKERVSQRLAASIGALALNAPIHSPSAVPARTIATGLRTLRAQPLVFLLGFACGGAAGAGLVASLHPQPKAEVRSAARLVSPNADTAKASSLAPDIAASAPQLPAVLRPPISVSARPVAPTQHGAATHLAEQQALLDVARKALSLGDYSSALQTLAVHFKRYPKSILAEEREALQIKALAATGQITTAHARAAQFKARFPQSLLLSTLTDSVGAIP